MSLAHEGQRLSCIQHLARAQAGSAEALTGRDVEGTWRRQEPQPGIRHLVPSFTSDCPWDPLYPFPSLRSHSVVSSRSSRWLLRPFWAWHSGTLAGDSHWTLASGLGLKTGNKAPCTWRAQQSTGGTRLLSGPHSERPGVWARQSQGEGMPPQWGAAGAVRTHDSRPWPEQCGGHGAGQETALGGSGDPWPHAVHMGGSRPELRVGAGHQEEPLPKNRSSD